MVEAATYVFIHLGAGPVPAGRLVMNDDEPRAPWASFAYGTRYLERDDRVAIDPEQLPLPPRAQDNAYLTEEGFATFGAIRDAAPDGWGRYLMYKAMRDRTPTEIDVILASGPHRVGALAFGPTPERPRRVMPWNGTDEADEFFPLAELARATEEAQQVDQLSEPLRRLLTAGSSLGGARPKGVTRREDGSEWIAKFPARADAIPECRVEYATMTLAARLGLEVPRIDFTRAWERDVYLIERFDRSPQDERRTHFVSGLTMLSAHEGEAHTYGYADLATALRRHGSAVRRDLRELYRRMLFNILVTNDDDHLRNHGFLWDGSGWRLSPLYDVVPKPQLSLERRLALAVGPEGRTATLGNAVAGAAQFDVDREEAVALAAGMAGEVANGWDVAFAEAGLGAADRARFATCFRMADPAVHRLGQADLSGRP